MFDKSSRLTVNLVHVVWCLAVIAFSPGAWQMVEMACSMLPSQTSHPGMALWTQAGSCYLAVDPSVGQAREDSKEHFLMWMGLPS